MSEKWYVLASVSRQKTRIEFSFFWSEKEKSRFQMDRSPSHDYGKKKFRGGGEGS